LGGGTGSNLFPRIAINKFNKKNKKITLLIVVEIETRRRRTNIIESE